MLPADPALRRRIALALCLVVVLPFAFLYAFELGVNFVLLPVLEGLGYGPYYGRVYVSPTFAVLLVGGGVLTQAWLGPRAVLGRIGARQLRSDEYPDLEATLTRLAHQVDMPTPEVAVVDNEAPNAAAVHGGTGATVVVTTGLVEELSPTEQEGVLAHEITHLKHRDATVMTVAWLLPTLTYYIAVAAGWLFFRIAAALGRGGRTRSNGRGLVHALVILTATAVLTIAISAFFWAASVLVHRVLSRYREFAADRGAAALTGNPAALATALRKIDARMPEVPDRDLRQLDGGTEALCFAPLEGRAFTDAELVSTDIFPDTHPETADRIERLETLTREGT